MIIMSLFKYILPLAALFCFAIPASASSWQVCKGTGEVVESTPQEDGTFALKVRVKEAVITDGMASIGESCVSGIFPVIVDISAETDMKPGTAVPLQFRSYSGMGENGPVSSQVWSLDTSG